MQWLFPNAAWLVHLASLLYVIAFLVRDQLTLRVLVLIATALYIAYYYFVPAQPLWDAIVWSVILGSANVLIMGMLLLERTTLGLSEEKLQLFRHFKTMTPGEFRKLLKIAEWQSADQPSILTREDEQCEKLYYLVSGSATIRKKRRKISIGDGAFIGEVAYFLRQNASATVTLQTGSEYVGWKHEDLAKLERKYPAIRIALHQMLSSDMAAKVAAS